MIRGSLVRVICITVTMLHMRNSAAEAKRLEGHAPRTGTADWAPTASVREAFQAGSERAVLGLPQVFSPAQAAEILRGVGLTEMTECALRTRAYRKQVPFHLNGRRIMFTLNDLREIAEGEPQPREPSAEVPASAHLTAPADSRRSRRRRSATRRGSAEPGAWRARRPGLPEAACVDKPQ